MLKLLLAHQLLRRGKDIASSEQVLTKFDYTKHILSCLGVGKSTNLEALEVDS